MSARTEVPSPAPSLPRVAGLVVVDKPLGWTSHDVVSRMRRLAGTRKVGHAGTLDPAATGVLVVGVEKATKLLTYVTGTDKTYETTIRLGAATVTDDAEGEVTRCASPEAVAALTRERILDGVARLTGEIQQVPSAVSAIKVNGERSYARVRKGEDVELAARPVTVREFTVHSVEPVRSGGSEPSVHVVPSAERESSVDREGSAGAVGPADPVGAGDSARPGDVVAVDVTATVTCSSGTYIRALARDLGDSLGVGGHLTALRRTRVGSFTLDQAHTLDELMEQVRAGGTVSTLPLEDAARGLFPTRELNAQEATDLSHGRRIAAAEETAVGPGDPGEGVVACFAPDGTLVALAEERGRGEKRYATSVLGIAAGVVFTDPAAAAPTASGSDSDSGSAEGPAGEDA